MITVRRLNPDIGPGKTESVVQFDFNIGPIMPVICRYTSNVRGTLLVAQWLRHCATNRKVVGSIPDGVKIFH
jgi:hypothetical protein